MRRRHGVNVILRQLCTWRNCRLPAHLHAPSLHLPHAPAGTHCRVPVPSATPAGACSRCWATWTTSARCSSTTNTPGEGGVAARSLLGPHPTALSISTHNNPPPPEPHTPCLPRPCKRSCTSPS